MADDSIRKSSRIRARKKTNYLEDDFEYDYDIHFDISSDISDILDSHSKQKCNDSTGKGRRSVPNLTKKIKKKAKSKQLDCTDDGNNAIYKNRLLNETVENSVNEDAQDSGLFGGSKVECPVCKVLLSTKQEMEEHMTQHLKNDGTLTKRHICDICGRISVDEAAYNRHMKSHSGNRKFKCNICSKAFAESCSLKRHMKTHDDDRPFTCDLCFKSFRDNPSLIRHLKTHTNRPRMWQCIKCDKTFADKHGLKRHERTHTGVRPFECEVCGKTFGESGSFKRHQKIHTGIRNYFCGVCNKSFLEKQSLLRHQKNVCGYGDGVPAGSSSLHGSVDMDQSRDSLYSGTNNSEVSCTSFEDGNSRNQTLDSVTSNNLNTQDSKSSAAKSTNFALPSVMSDAKNRDATETEKSEHGKGHKEAPSLHSLIKKDPNLYDSISEIVESIDSYEKMLDLCGERGQKEIEAAFTRDPAPMPDSLLCFECGELLVNGENFKSEGKMFHPTLNNSFKCLHCDDEDEDYGDPPVLIAEIQLESGKEADHQEILHNSAEENKLEIVGSANKTACGTDETIEHLRQRLKKQHGVYFIGDGYDSTGDDDDDEDAAVVSSSNTAVSRSNSTDSDIAHQIVQTSRNQQSMVHSALVDGLMRDSPSIVVTETSRDSSFNQGNNETDPMANSTGKETYFSLGPKQATWSNTTPKLEYEADDPNIPSVFPCHLCTKVFATSAFLERHLDLHRKSPHKCMVCGKTFTNAPSLKRHMTLHTGEKPYTCPTCRKSFRDPSNFSKHKKVCSASLSALSPADSISSTSSVSSPRSVDDNNFTGYGRDAGRCKDDPLQKQHDCASQPSTAVPLWFSYDNDDEEDLPVSFGHTAENVGEPPQLSHSSDTSGTVGLRDLKIKKTLRVVKKGGEKKNVVKEAKEGNLLFPCMICGKTFGSERYLEMHMKYHSGNPNVTCIECGKRFADPFGLKRHMRIHAGTRPHVCEYCQRGYCDNWSLKKHMSRGCLISEIKMQTDILHPCPQCTRVFAGTEYLQEHMKSHKGLLKFECDICQRRFSEAFNLKRHRRLHMAVCPGCEREFKDIEALAEHQVKECPANVPETAAATLTGKVDGFPCPECGRVYSTKAYLERHKKFHSDLKPYACEICSKKFSEAFRLRRHMTVHTDNKPFTCKGCGRRFTDATSLKRHIANTSCNPTKEQQLQLQQLEAHEFPCQLCEKVFPKNYLLVRHMNVHSQERPFSCDLCGRSYKDTSSLRRHQMVHQGIKDFICPICGKDFFYSDSLKRHMKGSCSKKSKSRHCGRGKGRRKAAHSKSNNNINMKNNNVITQGEITNSSPKKRKFTTKELSEASLNSPLDKEEISFRAEIPARNVQTSLWSCHKKRHCWRCSLKMKSSASLLQHARIHQHRKPYHCKHCYSRWARKPYWKAHLKSHETELTSKRLLAISVPVIPLVAAEKQKRPRRSVPRTRWSWISQI